MSSTAETRTAVDIDINKVMHDQLVDVEQCNSMLVKLAMKTSKGLVEIDPVKFTLDPVGANPQIRMTGNAYQQEETALCVSMIIDLRDGSYYEHQRTDLQELHHDKITTLLNKSITQRNLEMEREMMSKKTSSKTTVTKEEHEQIAEDRAKLIIRKAESGARVEDDREDAGSVCTVESAVSAMECAQLMESAEDRVLRELTQGPAATDIESAARTLPSPSFDIESVMTEEEKEEHYRLKADEEASRLKEARRRRALGKHRQAMDAEMDQYLHAIKNYSADHKELSRSKEELMAAVVQEETKQDGGLAVPSETRERKRSGRTHYYTTIGPDGQIEFVKAEEEEGEEKADGEKVDAGDGAAHKDQVTVEDVMDVGDDVEVASVASMASVAASETSVELEEVLQGSRIYLIQKFEQEWAEKQQEELASMGDTVSDARERYRILAKHRQEIEDRAREEEDLIRASYAKATAPVREEALARHRRKVAEELKTYYYNIRGITMRQDETVNVSVEKSSSATRVEVSLAEEEEKKWSKHVSGKVYEHTDVVIDEETQREMMRQEMERNKMYNIKFTEAIKKPAVMQDEDGNTMYNIKFTEAIARSGGDQAADRSTATIVETTLGESKESNQEEESNIYIKHYGDKMDAEDIIKQSDEEFMKRTYESTSEQSHKLTEANEVTESKKSEEESMFSMRTSEEGSYSMSYESKSSSSMKMESTSSSSKRTVVEETTDMVEASVQESAAETMEGEGGHQVFIKHYPGMDAEEVIEKAEDDFRSAAFTQQTEELVKKSHMQPQEAEPAGEQDGDVGDKAWRNVSGPPAPEKIFIGGFSFSYNEDDLRGVFDRFGQIKECFIVRDSETGSSKGYAFITYAHLDDASRAIAEMHDAMLDDNRVYVGYATKPSTETLAKSSSKEGSTADIASMTEENIKQVRQMEQHEESHQSTLDSVDIDARRQKLEDFMTEEEKKQLARDNEVKAILERSRRAREKSVAKQQKLMLALQRQEEEGQYPRSIDRLLRNVKFASFYDNKAWTK